MSYFYITLSLPSINSVEMRKIYASILTHYSGAMWYGMRCKEVQEAKRAEKYLAENDEIFLDEILRNDDEDYLRWLLRIEAARQDQI